MKCDARLPEVLSILASQNAVHCSESNLRSSIEAARWQRLFKDVCRRNRRPNRNRFVSEWLFGAFARQRLRANLSESVDLWQSVDLWK